MTQAFYVLQCFSCRIYQVQIVKLKPKWQCKMCNANQSVKKVFMRSFNAKQCRIYVQELNNHQGNEDNCHTNIFQRNETHQEGAESINIQVVQNDKDISKPNIGNSSNKWLRFVKQDENRQLSILKELNYSSSKSEISTENLTIGKQNIEETKVKIRNTKGLKFMHQHPGDEKCLSTIEHGSKRMKSFEEDEGQSNILNPSSKWLKFMNHSANSSSSRGQTILQENLDDVIEKPYGISESDLRGLYTSNNLNYTKAGCETRNVTNSENFNEFSIFNCLQTSNSDKKQNKMQFKSNKFITKVSSGENIYAENKSDLSNKDNRNIFGDPIFDCIGQDDIDFSFK